MRQLLTALAQVANAIIEVGWRAVLAAVLTLLGAFTIGYLLGGLDPDNREVIGLGTGQRNIAAATVVAAQSFSRPTRWL